MIRAIAVISLLAISILGGGEIAAEPTPFRAVYKADYKGLPVSVVGVRELRQIEDSKYLLSSTAKSFFASVTEQSIFTLDEQHPVPLEYQYKRTGIGKNRKVLLTFDRQAGKVISEIEPWDIDVTSETLDKLLYQYKMREDLHEALQNGQPWPDMNYKVADGGRIKNYNFKVTGEEFIVTPIGRIRTVKAIRIRKDGDRTTTFWLAPDYEFMLVRLLQTERKGKGFELLLTEAEFDGEQVQGL
jgi:Protein of unknown function (DUF3108)